MAAELSVEEEEMGLSEESKEVVGVGCSSPGVGWIDRHRVAAEDWVVLEFWAATELDVWAELEYSGFEGFAEMEGIVRGWGYGLRFLSLDLDGPWLLKWAGKNAHHEQ